MKTLLIGIGNPGRRDDGLGPALVERLSGSRSPERAIVKTVEGSADAFWAYQLNVEDASLVREYDRIIFVDAAAEAAALDERAGPAPLWRAGIEPLAPAVSIAFTTHEMSPASVLALSEELYGVAPTGFLLRIIGTDWGFAEGLSAEAERNLAEAERVLRDFTGKPQPAR